MIVPGSANALLLRTADTGYKVERSLRFNSSDSGYLSKVYGSNGNRTTWTISFWMKLGKLSAATPRKIFGAGTDYINTGITYVELTSNDQLRFFTYALSSGGYVWQKLTTQVFRDCSSWYHVCCAFDSSNGTASDRARVYVNGSRVATFASSSDPSSSYNSTVGNSTQTHHISGPTFDTAQYFDGYLADVFFIDGQALDPTSFTEVSATTGQLIPKAYTGSFGTNGFWLKFSDNSAATATTLGKDSSGNSNNWTPNNLSVTAGAGNDSLVDTPTNGSQADTGVGGEVVGNYCTLNPLAKGSSITLVNGNLEAYDSGATAPATGSTIAVSSGKWYWEVTLGNSTAYVGMSTVDAIRSSVFFLGQISGQFIYNPGQLPSCYIDGVAYNYSTGSNATTGDVIGVAINFDSNQVTFFKNGVSMGVFGSSYLSGRTWTPAFKSNTSSSAVFNFGQRPFAYTAPSGFKALCTTNLPEPVVAKPSEVMDVKLYTGNGSTQTISGLGFSPDLVWIKGRNYTVNHILYDAIRGSNKHLESSTTASEYTTTNALTSFDSTGFTLGSDSNNIVNQSTKTYAAWCWGAGSSTVTNTQGSITTTVRANPSAGFSVATWTGVDGTSTIGHGLNAAPAFWIIKPRSSANNWNVYHTSLGSNNLLFLNNTSAVFNSSMASSSVAPTSTVVTVKGNNAGWDNQSGVGYVMYAFAPVAGYSSFGSYTGNGSADGPFVYTGFRPRWVMVKRSSAAGSWYVYDAVRNTYNVANLGLFPNLSNAELTLAVPDILSNGFKLRNYEATYGDNYNANGSTYIYAAFAESPFQYARAR